jgi:two-component system response regulator NreC
MNRIRVLIVDDHTILRSGLRKLLEIEPDIEVVGEAADVTGAATAIRSLKPDVVTLDVSMPGGSGISLIQQVRDDSPGTRFVVLTMHADPAYCRTAVAAGAQGYVLKTSADTDLLVAIRAVHRGQVFIDLPSSENPTGVLSQAPAPKRSALSDREEQVLLLLARGHTNQEAAEKLVISEKSVATYRARLLTKLGLKTRAELVRYALESGLLSPGDVGP